VIGYYYTLRLLFCTGQAEQSLNFRYKECVRHTKNSRKKSALATHPKIQTPVWQNGKYIGCYEALKKGGYYS
jgi:hypothetical protein